MGDDVDPQNEITEEFVEDPQSPSTIICSFCGEENDALLLKSTLTNKCWNCGHFVDFCDYVAPYDIRVGGSARHPTGARLWFVWMARIFVVGFLISICLGLVEVIRQMVRLPLR